MSLLIPALQSQSFCFLSLVLPLLESHVGGRKAHPASMFEEQDPLTCLRGTKKNRTGGQAELYTCRVLSWLHRKLGIGAGELSKISHMGQCVQLNCCSRLFLDQLSDKDLPCLFPQGGKNHLKPMLLFAIGHRFLLLGGHLKELCQRPRDSPTQNNLNVSQTFDKTVYTLRISTIINLLIQLIFFVKNILSWILFLL